MANASRKTTLEERKEITEYCISHGKDYKGTAALYGVSHHQTYTCVKKYLSEEKRVFQTDVVYARVKEHLDDFENVA